MELQTTSHCVSKLVKPSSLGSKKDTHSSMADLCSKATHSNIRSRSGLRRSSYRVAGDDVDGAGIAGSLASLAGETKSTEGLKEVLVSR